jgi:hypothetical protein
MNAQLEMLNRNPKTWIAYGYISANQLDQEVVFELLHGMRAVNHTENEVLINFAVNEGFLAKGTSPGDAFEARRWLEDNCQNWEDDIPDTDEWIVTGTYEGVSYQSSWLGGALNFWIFESPVTTDKGRRASPCVPGACILDTLDGSESGYDVPAEWRADHE